MGEYSDTVGLTACKMCPGSSYSPIIGAVADTACSECKPNYCNGHGTCALQKGSFTANCVCQPGYLSVDRCTFPWVGVIVSVVLLIVIVCLFAVIRNRRRARRYKYGQEHYEKLLHKTEQEVRELNRAFHIDMNELKLVRKVDEGACGEVW